LLYWSTNKPLHMGYITATPKYALKSEFAKVVNERVYRYFSENNLSEKGTTRSAFKAGIFLFFHVFFYASVVNPNYADSVHFVAWAFMGFFTIPGIGFNIMHDAAHGAFSENEKVNRLLTLSGNLVGVFTPWWRIQHNVLHHTHTNVVGFDNDVDLYPLIRVHRSEKWLPVHRYQYIYAWLLYPFETINWIWYTDFTRFYKKRIGTYLINESPTKWKKLRREFFITKIVHVIAYVVLPIVLYGWHGFFGYLLAMGLSGLVLACVFQCAHQEEEIPIVTIDEVAQQGNDWVIHEMCHTTNFGKSRTALSWFVGGLNRQVEHHLFHSISNDHYAAIESIVEETAHEYGVPYHKHPSFGAALRSHGRHLYRMGLKPKNTSV
jgi:linoleoyl-CoA desaturase